MAGSICVACLGECEPFGTHWSEFPLRRSLADSVRNLLSLESIARMARSLVQGQARALGRGRSFGGGGVRSRRVQVARSLAVPVSRLTVPDGRLRFGLSFSYGREHPKFAGRGRTSEEGDGQGPAEEGNRADHLAAQTDGRADHQAAHVAARRTGYRAPAGRAHASTGGGACGRTGCCCSCGGCSASPGSRCCSGGGPSRGCRPCGTAGARGPRGLGRGPGTGHRSDRGRSPCPAFGGLFGIPAAARVRGARQCPAGI